MGSDHVSLPTGGQVGKVLGCAFAAFVPFSSSS